MPRNDGTGFRLIIILIITFLCLGISFIQMTKGYKEFGGSFMGGYFLSGVFSFIVVLILFYLIFELNKARKERKSVWGIMTWYLFFVLLSFAGNFNSFYTFFMKDGLVRAELNQKYEALSDLKAKAESAFKPPPLPTLLANLKFAIMNERYPGCGTDCKKIIAEIESNAEIRAKRGPIKHIEMKPLFSKSDKPEDKKRHLEEDYNNLEIQIIGAKEFNRLKEMDTQLGTFKEQVERGLKDSDIRYAQDSTKEIINKYNEDVIDIKQIPGTNLKADTNLNLLVFDNADLGKINQTFNSAFHNLAHWGTWISAFAALMIDLFVPLFILAFTKSGQKQSFSFGRRGAENLS